MAHLALYREFRPQRFADVVGQQHITRTLKNALVNNRMHHAYLLSGPRGTGKTTVARILAKAVNCKNPQDGEPCNECSACVSIMSGEAMDVIEIDAASNRGIEEIRDLRDKVKYAPAELKRKVYIIDEVHMLSEPAFNALLKTLEEPPAHVLFVLATTEKQKLPVTILSRCQCFEYHRHTTPEIVGRLQEVCGKYGLTATDEAVTAIARQADGGMRDALSLLDQVMAYAIGGQITLEDTLNVLGSAPLEEFLKLDERLVKGDVGATLLLLDELSRQGKDLRQLVRDYLTHMRDLLMLKVDTGGTTLDLPAHALEALKGQAAALSQEQILAGIRLFAQVENDLRFSSSPRLLIEVGLIRLTGVYSGQTPATPHQAEVPVAPVPVAAHRHHAAAVAVAAPAKAEETQADVPARQVPPDSGAEPVVPAPAGEGVERVVAVWEQVLDLVKRGRPSTHPLLAKARIARLAGNLLTIVPANASFVTLLKRPGDKKIIEQALARVGFPGLEVHPVGPEDPGARPDPTAGTGQDVTSKKPAGERTLVEIAQSVFPKELVQEVKEEESK